MRSCILSISQCHNPQQAFRVGGLELLQSIGCDHNSIVHQGRASCCGLSNQTIEVIDGLGKAALVLYGVIEEEKRDDVFQVVCDCSEGKCLEEGLHSADSLQVRFVEELAAHRARDIEEHSDGLLGRTSDDWLEISEVDNFFNALTLDIGTHEIQVDCFFIASQDIEDIEWLGDVFVLAHEDSQLAFFGLEGEVNRRLVFDFQGLVDLQLWVVLQALAIEVDCSACRRNNNWMLRVEADPKERICASVVNLIDQELEVKLLKSFKGQQLLFLGSFQQREGKALQDLLLEGLSIHQDKAAIVQFGQSSLSDGHHCEVAIPLDLHTLSLFPDVLGELQLEGSFEDEAKEISGLGEAFLPLQLIGNRVAAEQILCNCSKQSLLYGNSMRLTDEVIGEQAFQVVSKREVASQSSHKGNQFQLVISRKVGGQGQQSGPQLGDPLIQLLSGVLDILVVKFISVGGWNEVSLQFEAHLDDRILSNSE